MARPCGHSGPLVVIPFFLMPSYDAICYVLVCGHVGQDRRPCGKPAEVQGGHESDRDDILSLATCGQWQGQRNAEGRIVSVVADTYTAKKKDLRKAAAGDDSAA